MALGIEVQTRKMRIRCDWLEEETAKKRMNSEERESEVSSSFDQPRGKGEGGPNSTSFGLLEIGAMWELLPVFGSSLAVADTVFLASSGSTDKVLGE